ncbi:MAG: protein kinase [Polyangiaceae bacterium]|nr:protein kinase [Polyangiaceae bacterium]
MADGHSPSGVPTAFEPGRVLGGRFRVERELGAGGMGVVLVATHLELDEPVALKVMLPKCASNAEAASRFAREARASVKIRSEHIVRVLDVARLEDGTPYMVMEYLEGTDLAGLLEAQGPLPPPAAVAYVLQACDAIAAAHALGIIHRDLKPANLFLARRGDGTQGIKVLDFGISKLSVRLSERDATLTGTSVMMGSPPYMAPEQMLSAKSADARTDIWGLGCVLYELIVGSRPFRGTTMPELCAAIMAESPTPPSELRPDAPKGLDTVVLRCLEKSPAARYPTVAELASALAPFSPESSAVVAGILRRAAPDSVAPAPGASAPPPVNASDTAAAWGQTQTGLGRRGRRHSVMLTATAIVLGGAGWLSWRLVWPPPHAASPSTTARVATEPAQSTMKPPLPAAAGDKSAAPAGPSDRAATQPAVTLAVEPAASRPEPPAQSHAARPAVVRRTPPTGSTRISDAGAPGTTVAKPPVARTATAVPEPAPAPQTPKRRRTLDIGLK